MMTKPNRTLILSALAVALALAPAFAQMAGKVDLTGTWTGYTILGDGTRAQFNLILAKAGEGYAGKINDEAGMIPEMAIKNVDFKDPTLTFEIEFPDGAGYRLIKIDLKLEADTLKGSWLDADTNSNVIELARKK
jgi:hypothetical protein